MPVSFRKEIAGFDFPTSTSSPDWIENWKPTIRYMALHSEVLLVARTRIEGAWSAYCVPVPGDDHEKEIYLWRNEGNKILEEIARVVFPEFGELPYAK